MTTKTEIDLDRHATKGQAKAARALVNAILADPLNFTVSTQDGEEWTVKNSRDKAVILASLCSTEEDRIRIRHNGEIVGTFWLVWGNEDDGSTLIADYGWRDSYEGSEAIMKRLADSIPDEGFPNR